MGFRREEECSPASADSAIIKGSPDAGPGARSVKIIGTFFQGKRAVMSEKKGKNHIRFLER